MREKKIDKLLNSIIIIGIILNITFFGYLIYITQFPQYYHYPILPSRYLVIGVAKPTYTIDPVIATDRDSILPLEQVVETLFTYDLSNRSLPRIPLLTETYFWESNTVLHIKVREGIYFHDGVIFNANAVEWNFNRILYLTNCTGTLPSSIAPEDTSSLYFFPDGVTPIINSVISDGAYNVTFTLNGAFSPFLDLLSHISSAILSPASTPADDFIELIGGHLVGTGPFRFDLYVPYVEVRLKTFNTYWQGRAYFDVVVIAFIIDDVTRNNAMLGQEIDIIRGIKPSYIKYYDADVTIHVEYFSDKYNLPGFEYHYLGMNNKLIPTYWRKAISYAINYSYIIDEMLNGSVVRANGPITPSYGAPYNASNIAADYDLLTARQIIIDNVPAASGFPLNDDPDDFVWQSADLIELNFSYNIGNKFSQDLFPLLIQWLDAVGITLEDYAWDDFNLILFFEQDYLNLFWASWYPDYKDPFNMLDTLFNPLSYANSAQVNDTKLNTMMNLARATTDDAARNTIYKNIQWYLSNRLYPHCFGFHQKILYVHSAGIYNLWYNAMNDLRFFPIKKL